MRTEMKENLRRLRLIVRNIDVSKLFNITVDRWHITFYADFNANISKYMSTHKFTVETDSNGYIVYSRGIVRVVLT